MTGIRLPLTLNLVIYLLLNLGIANLLDVIDIVIRKLVLDLGLQLLLQWLVLFLRLKTIELRALINLLFFLLFGRRNRLIFAPWVLPNSSFVDLFIVHVYTLGLLEELDIHLARIRMKLVRLELILERVVGELQLILAFLTTIFRVLFLLHGLPLLFSFMGFLGLPLYLGVVHLRPVVLLHIRESPRAEERVLWFGLFLSRFLFFLLTFLLQLFLFHLSPLRFFSLLLLSHKILLPFLGLLRLLFFLPLKPQLFLFLLLLSRHFFLLPFQSLLCLLLSLRRLLFLPKLLLPFLSLLLCP